ncbi:ester cyclase [Dickeya zeae]|uniref:ester cyclase n=1 Tax=Dickeya zeae TaxID=204042 RepID=UPI00039B602C|nr:ester cyclase [Dickeya zeae]
MALNDDTGRGLYPKSTLFAGVNEVVDVARAYIEAYCEQDFATLRSLLNSDHFQFSHQSRGAYARDADSFIAMLEQMAVDIFPDRRFTQIRGMYAVGDLVLIDTEWRGTPIVTIPGRFEAGVILAMELKSMIVVQEGRITEIRDHDS